MNKHYPLSLSALLFLITLLPAHGQPLNQNIAANTVTHHRYIASFGTIAYNENPESRAANFPGMPSGLLAISNNTISSPQTICYNSTPVALTGTLPTGGGGPYTYQWQSSIVSATAGFSDVASANGQNFAPSSLTASTWYRRIVNSAGVADTSTAVKITVIAAISSNNISQDQSICTGQAPLSLNGPVATGATGGFTYQWISSTTSATTGFANASGTSNGQNYAPPALTQTTWYRRVAISGTCTDTSAPVQISVITSIPGNPTVYGNNIWNAYVYSDGYFLNYAGYYTEPSLSFISSSRYSISQSPSSASGYQGCLVQPTNFTVSFKRTNFTPGNYRIDVTAVDDQASLIINGVTVYTRGCCITPPTVNTVWIGALGATDNVEIRWVQGVSAAQIGFNFVPVVPAPLIPGSIAGNQSVCFGDAPASGFTSTAAATTGCTFNTYQWQISIDSIAWSDISGATSATYTETSALTQTKWYRRVAKDFCNNVAATLPVKVTVNITPPGDTSVYGDNVWNAYMYQYPSGNTNFSAATYRGFYIEPLLTFDSRSRWASGTSPSGASGYQGCYVAPNYTWMVFKRTNFASAIYQIDIPAHDDYAYLYINGQLVFSHVGCCDAHTNVWTGPLSSTDLVEYRVLQLAGGSYAAIKLTAVTPAPLTAGTITPSQTICAGNVPPTPFTEATAPTGGCTIKNYLWEYSTDGITWSAISGATAKTFAVPNSVYTQTLYRRTVMDVCGNSATSAPDTIYMNNAPPGDPTVYGNNVWNVYCFQDVNYSIYAGYYTEPSLTFATTSRYSSTAPPSTASGYQGCQLINTYYSASMKRTGIPAGLYQIDVTSDDDYNLIYINGVLVSSLQYPTIQNNVWTGNLTPADKIEVRWRNNAGPGQTGVRFTLVSPGALTPGSITAYNPNLCAGDLPIINNTTLASGACFVNYSWESSIDGGATWTTIAGATGSSYTASVSPTVNIQYRRVATDVCGNTATTTPVSFIQGAGAIGNPAVYGNGMWNVYCYNANGTSFSTATYLGYYTEPSLNFNSTTRWSSNGTPSDASGYQGCLVDADNHWVSYRRTNFTPGTYTLDVTTHDDDMYLLINGVVVFTHIGCCDAHANVWTGTLGATDQVEFRWREFYGASNGGLNLTLATPSTAVTGNVIAGNQIICSNTTPAAFTNTDSAHSGCFIYYQWQSQANCSGPWTDITGATGLTYSVGSNMTTKTCFRRKATNACGITSFSNTVTVDIYSTTIIPGNISSNQTICNGSTATVLSGTAPSGGDGNYTYQWQSSSDNIGWTNIAGATSSTYAPGAISATTYYRRNVSACAGTSSASSASVLITVNQLPAITVQPSNASACAGSNTSISVTASGTSLTYQWQVNSGSGWVNAVNGAIYSGVTTSTLNITGVTVAMNGYQYRVIVSGTCTPAVTSNISTLTISSTPVIGLQPANTTVCVGSTATFTVSASGSGLTYQWQQKIGAAPFSNITNGGVYSGAQSNTLVLTGVTAAMTGYSYQCIITSSCGGSSTSAVAVLTVVSAITNNIATDQNICSGINAASLTGNSNGTYTYAWQSSTVSAASGFVSASGTNNGAGYNPNPVATTTYYRRIVTNGGCSSTSNVVTINFNSTAFNISTQPANKAICAGGTATFSVAVNGPATLTYQWYEFNGTTNTALSDNAMYSGSTTNALTITGATLAMHNYRYFVKIFSSGCSTSSLTSNQATLTTNNPPVVTASTADFTTCAGNTININVTATGVGLTYQWQQNTGSGWNNLSNFGIYANVTTNSLRITNVTTALSGSQYRCIVSGSCSPTPATSAVTTMTVTPALSNNSISNSQTLCAGTPVPFTGSLPSGGNGTYTYQWMQNDGSGWVNIPGAISQNYAPGAITQTTQFLRTVFGGVCTSNNSVAITVTINPPTASSNPRDTAVCAGTNAVFNVTATGSSVAYQWQVNTGSGTFNNISNGIQYAGTTGASLTVLAPAAAMNGYQYRCVVTGSCVPTPITTTAAILTINPTATISSQPANATSCAGSNVTFSVTATAPGAIAYQWQEKTPSGVFTNIINGGIYSGAGSASLQLTGITAAMNGNLYRCVLTAGGCPINSANASLAVSSQPVLQITNPSPVCAPGTVDITAASITAGSTLAGGVLTYWKDAAATISLANPSAVAVQGTYYIKVSTSPVCYDIKPVFVTINPVITNNTISASQNICINTAPTTLTGLAPSGGNGTYQYQWQQSADNISWTDIPAANGGNYSPGTLTSTTYYRRVVTSGTCSSISSSITITVTPMPVASIVYNGSPYCPQGIATVTQTGTAGGTYSSTAGLVLNATTGAIDLATSTPGMYMVTYTFSNGPCSNNTSASVTINPKPTLLITNPAPVCAPATVDITAASVTTGSSSGLTYTYFTDAAATTALASPSAINTSGTYYIKGTAANGCYDVQPVQVTVNPKPSVVITDPAAVCAPSTIDLTQPAITAGSTNGLVYTYFKDAATTLPLSNSSAIANSGTYYIKGSAATGCYDVQPVTVTINPLPTATISYAGSPYCPTGTASVTLTGQAGGTFSAPSAVVINSATGDVDLASSTPGTYVITYNFTNGTCSSSTTASISINPNPSVIITDPAAVCAPTTVDLTLSGITAGSTNGLVYTYFADAAAKTPLSNAAAVALSGTYYIKGTAGTGCSSIMPVNVTVNPLPTATISYPGSPYCNNGTAAVTQTGITGGTYSSTAGLVIDATTGTVDLAASTPGLYTVQYAFTNGTCANTTSAQITIANKATLVVNDPSQVCTPSTVDLTAPSVTSGSTPGMTFNYFMDPAGTTNIPQPNKVANTGTYYIQGTVVSSGCTSAMLPVGVTINPKPAISVSADTTICLNTAATLVANSPGNSIVWTNVGNGSSVSVSPSSTTTYTAVATTAAGCSNSASTTVAVEDFVLSLSANPNPMLAGTNVTLSTNANASYNVLQWMPLQFFSNQTATSQTLVLTDTSKTFYVVAQSVNGCIDTASLLVKVDPNSKDFFIPNAFTPNNDGKNDVLKVYGSSIKELSMRIYNQWGELMFETNDPQRGWDGNYGGRPQPVGVYVYVVRVVLYESTVITKKGTISLIR